MKARAFIAVPNGWHARRSAEIEAIRCGRCRAAIARRQAREAKGVLDELQDAPVLVLHVRDVVLARVRRDDEQWDANAQTVFVDVGGRRFGWLLDVPPLTRRYSRTRAPTQSSAKAPGRRFGAAVCAARRCPNGDRRGSSDLL